MLPATRGAEVLYHNVLRPMLAQAKNRTQGGSVGSSNPFKQSEGFSMAGTTAPSSFEREPFSYYHRYHYQHDEGYVNGYPAAWQQNLLPQQRGPHSFRLSSGLQGMMLTTIADEKTL